MKHVCPYCETVHMNPAYVDVWYGDRKYEFVGLECPECGSKWITRDELITGLKRVAADSKKTPREVGEEFHLAVE